MENEAKRFRVAVAVAQKMARSIFSEEDYDFLRGFADVNEIDDLPDTMTHEYMSKILDGAEACITCWGTPAFTSAMLSQAKELRLIAHTAGSVKHLVPPDFWRSGKRITSNAPVIAEDVAHTVLAFIMFSLRGLWRNALSTRSGGWVGGETAVFGSRRLEGLQVGVVGASNVGREVIKKIQPFSCSIKLFDPYISRIEAASLGAELMGLDDLIASSDIITLHAPNNEECRHMINAGNISLMKDGVLFVNTARGMLVDEAALTKELETGRITACIDVTDPEPPAADHPFRRLDNVILTSHVAGGCTFNGRKMLGANIIKEVYNYLNKGLLSFEIRREMLDRMA